MDFVKKQNRPLPAVRQLLFRLIKNRAHILHPHPSRVELNEFALGIDSNELRQGGFTRPRRPVENNAGQPIRLQHSPQEFPLSQEMRLPNKFLQRRRSHPHRQRRDAREILLTGCGEKVHYRKCSPMEGGSAIVYPASPTYPLRFQATPQSLREYSQELPDVLPPETSNPEAPGREQ